MDAIVRVVVMYAFMLLVFRLAGKRTLGEATIFDFLLLLVISETTQQALLGDDPSLTHSMLAIVTFLTLNIGMSLVKQRSPAIERLLEDAPTLIVRDGQMLEDRMNRARVDREDILEAARRSHGLCRFEEIRHAVLERTGEISIVPRTPDG
jgi:uncharacterized membrane protein YcaP (DUF421 family)